MYFIFFAPSSTRYFNCDSWDVSVFLCIFFDKISQSLVAVAHKSWGQVRLTFSNKEMNVEVNDMNFGLKARHQTSQRQMCQNQFQNLMKSVSSEIFWKLPVSQLPKKFWFMIFLFVQYHFPKLVGALQKFACQPGRDWTLQPIINKCFHTFVSYSNSYSVSCFWKQKHLSWQPNSILHFTSCEKKICHRE